MPWSRGIAVKIFKSVEGARLVTDECRGHIMADAPGTIGKATPAGWEPMPVAADMNRENSALNYRLKKA